MRRTINILGLAEASSRAAQRASRGRALSPRGQRLMKADKDLVLLRGRLIQF